MTAIRNGTPRRGSTASSATPAATRSARAVPSNSGRAERPAYLAGMFIRGRSDRGVGRFRALTVPAGHHGDIPRTDGRRSQRGDVAALLAGVDAAWESAY